MNENMAEAFEKGLELVYNEIEIYPDDQNLDTLFNRPTILLLGYSQCIRASICWPIR